MMNVEHTASLEIDAPAHTVWAVISDVEHLPDALSGMTALAIQGDDPVLRVGLTWTQTRLIAGRTGSERLRVVEVEDGRSYVTEGGAYGVRYISTWTVDAVGAPCSVLTCTFAGIPHTMFARLLMRLFGGFGARATREAMSTDLRDIAVVATGGR